VSKLNSSVWARRASILTLSLTLVGLAGCTGFRIGSRDAINYGPIVRGGLKPVHQVPENCQPFAQGRLSVSKCYNDPNCRPCIMLAVRDIPPARAR
jgi:hypothetical protein